MGIDVYLEWDNKTNLEQVSFTGKTGYLREAYHGGNYATHILFPEDWATQGNGFVIPNEVLMARLPQAVDASKMRAMDLYKEDGTRAAQEFIDFVELHGRLEKEGRNPRICISY